MKLFLELLKFLAVIGIGFSLCTLLFFLFGSLLTLWQPIWMLLLKLIAIFGVLLLWGVLLVVASKLF